MKTATLTEKVNMWLHEHLAMKTPVKLLGGLALGALVMAATALPLGTTYADEPARPLSSVQFEEWPEVSSDSYTYHRFMLEQGKVGRVDSAALGSPISSVQFEYWPEVGFDSYTYHRFMSEQGKVGRRLSREQASVVEVSPVIDIGLGSNWDFLWDNQGNVVGVPPVIDVGLGSNWDFLSDNQGKVVEVSPVIDVGLGSSWDFL